MTQMTATLQQWLEQVAVGRTRFALLEILACIVDRYSSQVTSSAGLTIKTGGSALAKTGSAVTTLVANGPLASRACKKLVRDVSGAPMDEALRADTARRIADIRASDEGREGLQSFLQKRPPSWLAAPTAT